MSPARLPFHQRLTWGVHLFGALTRQRHTEMLPLLEQHVPKDGVIIDASAHKGQFAKLFAQVVPQGHVYAFEPRSYARSIISRVIAVKKLANVSLFPVGLGNSPSRTPTNDSGRGSCPVMNGGGKSDEEKIPLTTLDQFSFRHNLQRVDFIKADIEGREMSFLLGAHHVIEKFRPILFLEISKAPLQHTGDTAENVWNFLKALNYSISRIEDNGQTLNAIDVPITKGKIWCVAEERRKTV